MGSERSEDGPREPREWTDPRYAELVAAFDRSRRESPHGDARPPRFFLCELPDAPRHD